MLVNFVKTYKSPCFIKDENRVIRFLRDSTWCVTPNYLSRHYQCLFSKGVPILGNYGLIDDSRINHKAKEIVNQLKKLELPNGTLLLGELWNKDFDMMTRIIVSDTTTSLQLQEKFKLKYIITDILYFDNIDVSNQPYIIRRELLDEIFDGISLPDVSIVKCFFDEKQKFDYYLECEKKNLSMIFINKEKSFYESTSYKFTHSLIFHCVVMDVNIKNDLAYSLSLGMYKNNKLVNVGNATGLTYNDSVLFSKNRERMLGKVVKVSTSKQCKNKLKNPKYVKLCEEIMKSSCMW